MLFHLVRAGRVLREDGVGAAEQQLGDRVGVAGIALEREAELGLDPLQVLLVLRAGLDRDAQALEAVRRGDMLRVARLHEQHAMRPHVRDRRELLRAIRGDEDAADHDVALVRRERGQEARERGLHERRLAAPGRRDRVRHVDVEADRLAGCRLRLHRRERRVAAELERRHLRGAGGRADGDGGRRDCERGEQEREPSHRCLLGLGNEERTAESPVVARIAASGMFRSGIDEEAPGRSVRAAGSSRRRCDEPARRTPSSSRFAGKAAGA